MDVILGWLVLLLAVVVAVVAARSVLGHLRVLRLSARSLRPRVRAYFASRSLQRTREHATALAKHKPLAEALDDPLFHKVVAQLASGSSRPNHALRAAQDEDVLVAAIGLTALALRADVPAANDLTDWAVSVLSTCPGPLEPLIYSVLIRHATRPVIGSVLCKIDEGLDQAELAAFVRARSAAGEPVTDETFRGRVPYRHISWIRELVAEHSATLGHEFCAAFDAWAAAVEVASRDTIAAEPRNLQEGAEEFIRSFARVWTRPFDDPPALMVGRRERVVQKIEETVSKGQKSVLLVGPPGVGKSALIGAALERLPGYRFVFEAGAAQAYAGCIYVGELETKVEQIANAVAGTGAVWVFPALDDAISAGQHSRSPRGMFDAMQPHLRSGAVTVVAEVTEAGLERLRAERPGSSASFEVLRVWPLDLADSMTVVRSSLGRTGLTVADYTLSEAYELSRQFIADTAPPGNLIGLFADTGDEILEEGRTTIEMGDVLRHLSEGSGVPLELLDRHTPLDLDEVQRFFDARILHQPEAIEAVVERLTLVKAGLTDSTRPFGVLFFVGPTGTGKTELAKALAERMFGSAERMIRLDMSEYVTAEGLERLLASRGGDGRGTSLIAAVRNDPFAVILLDEFEKAAPVVWDLFLQVFEDGRLTDSDGATVDFRRTVLIMTSNVGSAVATKPSLGFGASSETNDPRRVRDLVEKSFPPEFVNRIDRIVVFRAFERAQMEELLNKELAASLDRRGIRDRPWAVELEPAAREFLIDHGFSPALGARPLKRAIERYLLAPIARAVVGHGVPRGDQFVLVTRDGDSLRVRFVDPDVSTDSDVNYTHDRLPLDGRHSTKISVKLLALSPTVSAASVQFLRDDVTRIEQGARLADLERRKGAALVAINEAGFWERPSRYAQLARAEYLDRFMTALATARRLAERLFRHAVADSSPETRKRVQELALRLHVLESALTGLEAAAATDVFICLRPWRNQDRRPQQRASEFVDTLSAMYESWADRRGMRIAELIGESDARIYGVSGLGCGTILEPESGLHLSSTGRHSGNDGGRQARAVVEVCVVPWPAGPEESEAALLGRARSALEEGRCPNETVRRYRTGPSPLVRDTVRGYRTGRIADVLAGDFDLF